MTLFVAVTSGFVGSVVTSLFWVRECRKQGEEYAAEILEECQRFDALEQSNKRLADAVMAHYKVCPARAIKNKDRIYRAVMN